MTTYYHVSATWTEGDDLLCWDELEIQGRITGADWKWDEADMGFDGDVICLFEDADAAEEFAAEHGGRVLVVEIPDDHKEWDVTMTRVAEGYPAVYRRIPAEWVKEL